MPNTTLNQPFVVRTDEDPIHVQTQLHHLHDRRPGLRRPVVHGRDRLPHAAPRPPGRVRRPLHRLVLELARLLAVARVAADGSLPGQRRRARHPGRPSHGQRAAAVHAHAGDRAARRRLSHAHGRQVAPRPAAGQPPQRPRLRGLVRLPGRLHRLLLAHLLLGHEPARPRHQPHARPVAQRGRSVGQRPLLHRGDHGEGD